MQESPSEAGAKAPARKPVPPSALALLAADAEGYQIVSVHVKHAYRIAANGTCTPADETVPLLFPKAPSEDDEYGVPESDVIPFKNSTDVILMTEAHAPPLTTHMDVRFQVGEFERVYRVYGERRCIYHGPGSYTFSSPQQFEKVPIGYAYAYGGVDPSYELPEQMRFEDALSLPPNAYPRNTLGMGYAIGEKKERLDGMLLPQVENPADLLTPARLVVPNPELWWRQPFPWSADWFEQLWYPRHAEYGTLPRGLPDDDRDMFEVRSGWVRPGQQRWLAEIPAADRLTIRCADAASPAWILPFMKGDEMVRLERVLPGGRSLVFRLPGKPPRVRVTVEGKTYEAPARLNRVLISTVQMGVYLVWHAAIHPEVPLPLRHITRAEPDIPPLEGVTVTADGVPVVSYEQWETENAVKGAQS